MSDWRESLKAAEKSLEDRIRVECKNTHALANMFKNVVENIIFLEIRKVAALGHTEPFTVEGLDVSVVKAWNSLMPGHVRSNEDVKHEADKTSAWIAFSDLLSEDLRTRCPDVIADSERVYLLGFGNDEAMRQRAADAVVEVVMPLMTAGLIKPVMCRATECEKTGEFVKFGLYGWQPVLLDMNDNEISVTRQGPETEENGLSL